jgi:hypothetical protein
MQYACKLKVNTEPQIIRYEELIDFGYNCPELTIDELISYGVTNGDSFQIFEEENSREYKMIIYHNRLETPDEVDKRVSKEIAYNKAYDEFHERLNIK